MTAVPAVTDLPGAQRRAKEIARQVRAVAHPSPGRRPGWLTFGSRSPRLIVHGCALMAVAMRPSTVRTGSGPLAPRSRRDRPDPQVRPVPGCRAHPRALGSRRPLLAFPAGIPVGAGLFTHDAYSIVALDAMRVGLRRSVMEPAVRVPDERLAGLVIAVEPAQVPRAVQVVDEMIVVVVAVMPLVVSVATASAVLGLDRDFDVLSRVRLMHEMFVVLSRTLGDVAYSAVFPNFLSGLLRGGNLFFASASTASAVGFRWEREAGVGAVLGGAGVRVGLRGNRQRHERPGRHRRADVSEQGSVVDRSRQRPPASRWMNHLNTPR
jgi:hypothetical protein